MTSHEFQPCRDGCWGLTPPSKMVRMCDTLLFNDFHARVSNVLHVATKNVTQLIVDTLTTSCLIHLRFSSRAVRCYYSFIALGTHTHNHTATGFGPDVLIVSVFFDLPVVLPIDSYPCERLTSPEVSEYIYID